MTLFIQLIKVLFKLYSSCLVIIKPTGMPYWHGRLKMQTLLLGYCVHIKNLSTPPQRVRPIREMAKNLQVCQIGIPNQNY
jgi:hypothetical protein